MLKIWNLCLILVIDDTLMFYFFKLYHNQIEFSKLIKCISTFYTNIFNDKNNFDRSGNLKRSTVKKLTKVIVNEADNIKLLDKISVKPTISEQE